MRKIYLHKNFGRGQAHPILKPPVGGAKCRIFTLGAMNAIARLASTDIMEAAKPRI
jgi:hypothetical protein